MKIEYNKRQKELMKDAGFACPADDAFNEDQLLELEEKVSDYMLACCLDENQNMTPLSEEYLKILNMLAE